MPRLARESFDKRYHDRANRRLVYVGARSSPEMWDNLWTASEETVREALKPGRGTKWLVRLTRRYVAPQDGPILEGGCGPAHNVAALKRAGYRVSGLDFAPLTVAALKRFAPELPITLGDLRLLPFRDNSFAGVWSLGVIEHFFNGYGPLAEEMARVVRPGGYIFLTFPYMSPLRRLCARFQQYPTLDAASEPSGFYQFALNAADVATELQRYGLQRRYQTSMSGLQGFKDEVGVVRKPLQRLHDYGGRSMVIRGIRFAMEGLAFFGAGHSCVMVLQKQDRS